MSTQIAVRLPETQVEFLDALVKNGLAPSRSEVISSAVEREIRRRMAERDAEIIRRTGPADDLDDLVNWTAHYHA